MINCQLESKMTAIDMQIFSDLFYRKMLENELMLKFIFKNNTKAFGVFIDAACTFAAKFAKTVTCRNADGKIIACAILYDRPEDKDLSFGSFIKEYGFFSSIGKIFKIGFGNLNRLTAMEKQYEKHKINEPHIYIQMLASDQKGMGAEVLDFIKQQFSDRVLYLESSVVKNDHAYYRKHGFTEFARVETDGFEQVLFKRKPSSAI